MAGEARETPEDFADRLVMAMQAEGKSPTRTEREAGLKRGYMTQLKGGKIRAPGPETLRQLADYLHISYEWLAIGRGSMRRQGWAPSPLEEAQLFARNHGAREDAILAATERYRDEPDMDVWSWIAAIDAEVRRLERHSVPRPEDVAKAQARVRRVQNKKRRDAETTRAELAERARQRKPA